MEKEKSLAQTVRQMQNDQNADDLVYDENSGEFVQAPRGMATEGTVVTEMTDKGYAGV
jgi:hypothetical protein